MSSSFAIKQCMISLLHGLLSHSTMHFGSQKDEAIYNRYYAFTYNKVLIAPFFHCGLSYSPLRLHTQLVTPNHWLVTQRMNMR